MSISEVEYFVKITQLQLHWTGGDVRTSPPIQTGGYVGTPTDT